MGFNLTNWFLRKKIDAHVRSSGQPMEHSRVINPYHAVSIESGSKACAESLKHSGVRFLASSAPMLPLRGCTTASCQCRYLHHNDRRTPRDRRNQPHNPHAHKMSERRQTGRRLND